MPQRVLVVEDDSDILSLVCAVLEDAGFDVASSVGSETLAVVQQEHPDLILLDYQMPGMDGVHIAQMLHARPETRDIPIIAMTAAGRAPTVCQEMGADGCLGKPFDIDHLIAAVERLMHFTH